LELAATLTFRDWGKKDRAERWRQLYKPRGGLGVRARNQDAAREVDWLGRTLARARGRPEKGDDGRAPLGNGCGGKEVERASTGPN
jgi:hypothetical protein